MARIELRDCIVRFKDGMAGVAAINDMTPPVATDTSITIDGVVLNTTVTGQVPVGARFTIAGETASTTVHTVVTRTPSSGTTTSITITPALGAGTYLDDGVLTFLNNEIEIKVGDGNITYTKNKEYEYLLDRGDLDTVREGNQIPMDVNVDFVYEFIRSVTGGAVTPSDAISGEGGAAEWVSSSDDDCEPYAIDIEIEHTPPCTGTPETTTLPDFRADSEECDLGAATVSAQGRCNATKPLYVRG
jgi:hypothetical protein